LIIAEGNHANDVSLSKVNLLAFACDYSELHKPPKEPEHSDFFLSSSKSLLKAPNHEHEPIKEWILNVQEKPQSPFPNYPAATL